MSHAASSTPQSASVEPAPQYGALVLRLALGSLLLAHGLFKVLNLGGVREYFASLGLPADLVLLVLAVELLAGLALIAGWRTRWAAFAVIPVLLGATWAHAGNGWLFSGNGGGWEFPALLVALAAVQALVGDGAYALSRLGSLRWRRQVEAAQA